MKRALNKLPLVMIVMVTGFYGIVMDAQPASQEQIDYTIARHLTTLLRSAREVISHHQDLINEQKAGKDLTAKRVLEEAKANYAKAMGHHFPKLDKNTLEGRLLLALEDSVLDVMDQAQPLINDPNRGFKGFVPAVFAYEVADSFDQKVGDVAYLKLTAPEELIRHKSNMPDGWEKQIIKNKFQSAGWKKGQFVAEDAELKGKKAFRLLTPEYYQASCLACHGEPKGATDITGGKKEGGKLGDLGGAISAAIYLR